MSLELFIYKNFVCQGTALLTSSYYNKGSAFPPDERREFNLHGLLPPNVQPLESQVKRAYEQYSSCQDALSKNIFMTSLKDQNIVLYYKVHDFSDTEAGKLIWSHNFNPADSKSLEGDFQHHLHSYRRGSHSKFLTSLSQTRRVLSQYL